MTPAQPPPDASVAPLPRVRTEREIYSQLESQRRLRLARGIALLFSILGAFFAIPLLVTYLSSPIHPPLSLHVWNATDLFVLEEATDLALVVLLMFGYMAARRERVNLAVGSISITFVFGTILFEVAQFISVGKVDAIGITSFIPLNTIIVLIGLLADPPLIVGATIAMNLFVILVVQFMPLDPTLPFQKIYLQSTLPTLQWGVAIVMLAAWRNFRATFLALGKSQIEIDLARQLDDLKDQFIASVNHELRNPVMAMHGYVELFRLTENRLSYPERAALIDQASQAGKELTALIKSILDVRRVDQAGEPFIPEPVDIHKTIETAIQLIDPREVQGQQRDLLLTIPAGMAIWGEPVRFQQILTNLFSNAVKYSAPGTAIEVEARLVVVAPTRRNQFPTPQVEITVRDHGLGIPPEQIPLLFNRFVRLPRDLASSVIGNGLGLYLCRVYAEAMHGSILVESSGVPGEGARFFLRLPAPPARLPAPAAEVAEVVVIGGRGSGE